MSGDNIPSFWASVVPSSPSSYNCVAHPTFWASESHSQSTGDIFHSAAENVLVKQCGLVIMFIKCPLYSLEKKKKKKLQIDL